MTIKRIGDYIPVDTEGYFVNPTSKDKVVSPWKEAVEEIKQIYLDLYKPNIISIYLRGSVPKGEAIAGISDIDAFAVINVAVSQIDRSLINTECEKLLHKYPFLTKIEREFVFYENLLNPNKAHGRKFIIKTQSLLLYGEDISQSIEKYKPDHKLASLLVADISPIIHEVRAEITNEDSGKNTEVLCRWIMKQILRNGFLLTMAEEQKYARDLYLCYEVLAKKYPLKEKELKKILELAVMPTSDKDTMLEVLDGIGEFISQEIKINFLKSD